MERAGEKAACCMGMQQHVSVCMCQNMPNEQRIEDEPNSAL